MGFSLKKLAGKAIGLVKVAAPIALMVLPGGKVTKAIGIASKVLPIVKTLISKIRRNGMNPFEKLVRDLIETLVGLKSASGLDIAFALVPVLLNARGVLNIVQSQDRAIWAPQLKAALDGMIGDEPDAIIGPGANCKIRVDLKYVSVEKLSDLIFDSLEKALLAQTE